VRKERFYPVVEEPWLAKLDTVIHELYHIDPEQTASAASIAAMDLLGQLPRSALFQRVAEMVKAYLATRPDPGLLDFLRHDFGALEAIHGGVCATTFRTFPSYPQRYIETLEDQPPFELDLRAIDVQTIKVANQPRRYTEDDLHIRSSCATPPGRSSARVSSGRACAPAAVIPETCTTSVTSSEDWIPASRSGQ